MQKQMNMSDDIGRALKTMERLDPQENVRRSQNPNEILQSKLRSFGQANTKQTSVGMSFATNFESFGNFKTYIKK